MRGPGENVASLFRRGYGGQDVKMLPMSIPIVNERKTAMKKMMMAVGFAAMVAAAGCCVCDVPSDAAVDQMNRQYIRLDMRV